MANDQGTGPDSPSQSDASGAPLPDTTDASGAPTPSDSDAGSAVTLTTLPWAIDHKPDTRALPSWFRRAVVMVLILVILSQIAVWAFGQLTSFWYTLFLSFFLGITMEPLVNRLARNGKLEASVEGFIKPFLDKSPAVMSLAKEAMRKRGRAGDLATALRDVETIYLQKLLNTEDAREGVAALLEKRPPSWQGR